MTQKTATSRPLIKYRVTLRLHALMAERRIRFVTDLWKLLNALGTVEISHSQLTRVVNNQANKLDVALLEGLATVFDCPVADLFER
jgi:DNA-binding Xre family transcriptional regulator